MNGSNTCIKDSGVISIAICSIRVTTYLKLSQVIVELNFPASTGIFFFFNHCGDEYRKRHLCYGLNLSVLNLCAAVTRDSLSCVGSLKNSEITVGMRGTQWAHVTVSEHIMGHAF